MYKVLDIVSPTEDQVREWGFDEDLLLTDQDEDLILYANQYVTVLWELACDPECPKNEYCLSILSNYSKSLFLTNNSKSIKKIASAIEDKQNNLSAPCLDWVRDFNRCNVLLSHPQTIDLSEADYIARYLLSGDEEFPEIKRTDRTHSGFIEYVKFGAYETYLYINLKNSKWKVSRFHTLLE